MRKYIYLTSVLYYNFELLLFNYLHYVLLYTYTLLHFSGEYCTHLLHFITALVTIYYYLCKEFKCIILQYNIHDSESTPVKIWKPNIHFVSCLFSGCLWFRMQTNRLGVCEDQCCAPVEETFHRFVYKVNNMLVKWSMKHIIKCLEVIQVTIKHNHSWSNRFLICFICWCKWIHIN